MWRLFQCARSVACAMLSLLCLSAAAAGTPAQPPVEAFAALPAISTVRLSPDGKHAAALQNHHGRYALIIYEIGAPPGAPPAYLTDPNRDFVIVRWANNEHVLTWLYQSSAGRGDTLGPSFDILSVDLTAQKAVKLPYTEVVGTHAGDANHILMQGYGNSGLTLFRVDIQTGMAEPYLTANNYTQLSSGRSTIKYIADEHSNLIGRIERSKEPLVDHLQVFRDGTLVEIASWSVDDDYVTKWPQLSSGGRSILRVALDQPSGLMSVISHDIATGKIAPYYVNPKYDVISIAYDDAEVRAVGALYADDLLTLYWFDPALRALQKGLDAAFPGQFAAVASMDAAQNKVAVQTFNAKQAPSWFLLDRTTHKAAFIGEEHPDLHAADLGDSKPYPYKARDGLDISAYLTLPPGKPAKELPVVVLMHADRNGRAMLNFDWQVQFFANRGYAVLQPNARGSSGFGHAFLQASYGQWGLKVQDDITDGVLKLIGDGIADPKRICIAGWRTGGYDALAAVAFTPHLYACAIAFEGVSDLPAKIKDVDNLYAAHTASRGWWNAQLGTIGDDLLRLKATSPARNAERVRAPVLLIHFDGDPFNRIEQSERMNDALRAAGKDVTFLRWRGDADSHMLKAETRARYLTEVEKFLAKYLGP